MHARAALRSFGAEVAQVELVAHRVFPFKFQFTYETHFRSVRAGSDRNVERHDPSQNWAKGEMRVISLLSLPIVWHALVAQRTKHLGAAGIPPRATVAPTLGTQVAI